jgi:hypothetical protein
MNDRNKLCAALAAALWFTTDVATAGVTFDVDVPKGMLDGEKHGRLVVYLAAQPHSVREMVSSPADWDYLHDPMPVYAIDATLSDSGHVVLDAKSDTFSTAMDKLAPGTWTAQAVFDHQSVASSFRMEPGNLLSEAKTFEIKTGDDQVVHLSLTQAIKPRDYGDSAAEEVKIRSKLLSDFAHRDVYLYAGITLPIDYKADGHYAAVYEIPGFGGDRYVAAEESERRTRLARRKDNSPARRLAMRAFHITLDPESPNGHTLFADSDVNGPYGRALVEELIPAIEKKYPSLIAEPKARLLAGHSSGGWAACWLQTQYDSTFGGAWPSSPDPIDFRKFEIIDLYAQDNLYVRDGTEIASVRDDKGKVTLRVREENTWEAVVGPNNAGGLQWASWQAVFGLPRGDGYPKWLWDVHTGAIDKSQIDHYRKYDMSALLRAEPQKYAPIWREKIRLLVGGADDYYLDEAVKLFSEELAKVTPTGTPDANRGYFKIVPGKTHGTIYETDEMRQVDQEMLDQLDAAK